VYGYYCMKVEDVLFMEWMWMNLQSGLGITRWQCDVLHHASCCIIFDLYSCLVELSIYYFKIHTLNTYSGSSINVFLYCCRPHPRTRLVPFSKCFKLHFSGIILPPDARNSPFLHISLHVAGQCFTKITLRYILNSERRLICPGEQVHPRLWFIGKE